MELQFLLRDELVNEKNVIHCLDTKEGECECFIHEGRLKEGYGSKTVYFIDVWLSGEGKLDQFCIPTHRKASVLLYLRDTISYEYNITRNELDKLFFFRDVMYFNNEEVNILEDSERLLEQLRNELEELTENDEDDIDFTSKISLEFKTKLADAKTTLNDVGIKIASKKAKKVGIPNVIGMIDDLMTNSEAITNEKRREFIDDGRLDLEWTY
jgi:hypothetical protein